MAKRLEQLLEKLTGRKGNEGSSGEEEEQENGAAQNESMEGNEEEVINLDSSSSEDGVGARVGRPKKR